MCVSYPVYGGYAVNCFQSDRWCDRLSHWWKHVAVLQGSQGSGDDTSRQILEGRSFSN